MTRKVTKATLTPKGLRDWRGKVGLSQAGFGERLGLTQQMIGHYESGLHTIQPRTILQIQALCKLWGIDPPRAGSRARVSR